MAALAFLLLCSAFYSLASAEKSFVISAYRDKIESTHLENRQIGQVHGKLARSLYWYGHWTVGATPNMKLLIDTGSSDLILPGGQYVPFNKTRFEGHQNFSIEYEGVNRAGFGFQQTNGTVRRDRVSNGDLVVETQAIGEVTANKFFDVPTPKNYNISSGNGIIGFLGRKSSSFTPPARSWFRHLCYDKTIDECRFGMAFGTNGTGQVVIGKLATHLIDGPLTHVRVLEGYTVLGDVVVNGETVFENQTLIMDVGTDNLQGPLGPVQKIFDMLGFQGVVKTGKNLFYPKIPVKNLFGYFECDKPPSLGFAFPTKSQLKEGEEQRVFNISTSTGIWDVYPQKSPNNCTSILGGTNGLTDPKNGETFWLIGQPFFQGHYIDFNVDAGTVSYGDLVNPETGT